MRAIPDPSVVGGYVLEVRDFTPIPDLLESLSKFPSVSRIRLSKHLQTYYETLPSAVAAILPEVEISFFTPEQLDALASDVSIPEWVISAQNFHNILSGNYLAIRPVTAEVVPTLNCTFRCEQCSYAPAKMSENVWIQRSPENSEAKFIYNFRNNGIHMPVEVMQVVIDRLIDGGVENVLFTGGGEPLMNWGATLLGLRQVKQRHHTAGLYTNGCLLTSSRIRCILDTEPMFVRLSVYGGNSQQFANYTGSDARLYDRVIQNVQLMAKAKLESQSPTIFGLSYLLHPDTYDGIADFADRILTTLSSQELGQINYIRFTPAVDYFDGIQHPRTELARAFELVEGVVMPRFVGTGVKIRPFYHRFHDLYLPKPYGACRAHGWYMEVGPNGDAFLCCEKLFIPDYKIGNLVEQSLSDILDSEPRKDVIQRVNNACCRDCPPLCKPHELNKLFEHIETLHQVGDESPIWQWRQDLLRSGQRGSTFAGRLDRFES